MTAKTDWTHRHLRIEDIRKLNKLYVIKIFDSTVQEQIESPLFVKDTIFEERIRSYFLKDISLISREDILSVRWNMYITQGFYIKINDSGVIEKFYHDQNKWYVSYLEIDGPLGEFCSVYSNVKESNK